MEAFKKITLLYAEDETAIRENAVLFLSRLFHKVHAASDGLEAWQTYEREKPHIVITDIRMPKLNGIDLAKRIRTNDKQTQIIILSAYPTQSNLLDAIELHLVRFLVKPAGERTLLDALQVGTQVLFEHDDNVKLLAADVKYDTFNRILVRNGNLVKLTANEQKMLDLLCKNSERVVTYEEIESTVWDDKYMSPDALRTLVTALRRKLSGALIENVSRTGYRLHRHQAS